MNTNLICKITDDLIGETAVEMKDPFLRRGARGIVLRDDGQIAVFNKVNKNEFKLPGGGLENDETPEEAFIREVMEETGCKVEIIESLGTVEEYRSHDNFKQISYVFVGRVLEDTKQLHLTQKESDEGSTMVWKTKEEALNLITDCYDKVVASAYATVYHTKFIVTRDRKILEKYIELEQITDK